MRTRNLLTLATGAVVALVLAAPTLASSGAKWTAWKSFAPSTASPSSSFAGWEDNNVHGGTTVTTTLVLPKLQCQSAKQVIYPSVGAYFAPLPPAFSSAGVYLACSGGKARYYPTLWINGNMHIYKQLKANAGDTVVLKSSMKPSGTIEEFNDQTTKSASKKLTGHGVTGGVGFPWVGDSGWPPYSSTPTFGVPNFGHITFSHTLVFHQPFGTDPSISQSDRYNGPTLQISSSAFKSDNETFKTVFHHS